MEGGGGGGNGGGGKRKQGKRGRKEARIGRVAV